MLRKQDYEIMRENIDLAKSIFNKKLSEEKKIQIINESEYKLEVLNEKMHYPDNMDSVYGLVWKQVEPNIPKATIEKGLELFLNISTEYFNGIIIGLYPRLEENKVSADITEYVGEYHYGNNFENIQLINPYIKLEYPITKDGFTCSPYIRTSLIHELTHLYDEWINRTKGIEYRPFKTTANKQAQEMLSSYGKDVMTVISNMLYMYSKSEEKSFMAQALNELETIGCDSSNYKNKMKKTTLYKNITEIMGAVENTIAKADYDDLFTINLISHQINGCAIPRIPIKNFDKSTYIDKIRNLSDKIYHDYMKRYISIVYYYLSSWKYNNKTNVTGSWKKNLV